MTPKIKEKEVSIIIPPKKELVLEGDPEKQLEFAMKAANALMKAVGQKPKKVMIRGEQYLEYGDWQTLARFFGATASVAWSRPIMDTKGSLTGYEARAEVLHQGQVISSAEAMCMRVERNWRDRDEFMLRSMAQTRASAKALRNAYGWVAELAGMKSTPAEEMGDQYDQTPIKAETVPVVYMDDHEAAPQVAPERPAVIGGKGNVNSAETRKVREEIMKLLDDKSGEPFLNGAYEYKAACKRLTNVDLIPANYATVLERLRAI